MHRSIIFYCSKLENTQMPAQLTVEVYLVFSWWNTTQSRESINYKCMPKNVDKYYKHKIEQKLPDKQRMHCVITFIQSSIIGKAIYEVSSQDNIILWGIETGIQQKKMCFWSTGNILFLDLNASFTNVTFSVCILCFHKNYKMKFSQERKHKIKWLHQLIFLMICGENNTKLRKLFHNIENGE